MTARPDSSRHHPQSPHADPVDPDDPMLSEHRLRAPEALRLHADGVLRLLDVRKAPARGAAGATVAETTWRDPLSFDPNAVAADDARPFALYCVHGHEVSQNAAEALRRIGRVAYFVGGGFEALCAAGAPLGPLGPLERSAQSGTTQGTRDGGEQR